MGRFELRSETTALESHQKNKAIFSRHFIACGTPVQRLKAPDSAWRSRSDSRNCMAVHWGWRAKAARGVAFTFHYQLVRHFDSHNRRKLKLGRESVRRQRFWSLRTIAMQRCSFRQTSPPQDTN